MIKMVNPAGRGALLTLLTLFGGLLIGLIAGDIAFRLIPGSSINDVKLGHAAIASIPALIGFLAGGAAWGIFMGRLAGNNDRRRMGLAGMLGFGPISILLATLLGLAEPALVGYFAQVGQPIHRVFTILFVPSAFLIAGTSALAIGIGLGAAKLARSLFWRVGLTAAITFLVINLIMESLGWVVGAPGAAERATMITVLALGNTAAALTGGFVMGMSMDKYRIMNFPIQRGTMVYHEGTNPSGND
jgi:hypothetical protein